MVEPKPRKVTKKDWDKVEKFVTGEFESRKDLQFRKEHEAKWKEVDRQIAMNPMERKTPDGKDLPKSWHNVFELGELSKASEIIAADVMRIMFPNDNWFECHVEKPETIITAIAREMPSSLDAAQNMADGVLRSLMSQQHIDFGLRSRVELSVKEALHHGSFVAIPVFREEMLAKDGKIGSQGSPVWVPYSMWNSYPDPSPTIIPTGIFYTGSMIVVDYMKKSIFKQLSGEGWMKERFSKIPEEEHDDGKNRTKDYQIITYIGDVSIERGDGDIYLPNVTVKTANGVLVYYKENDLPYSNVIYSGYERQDIRDPYYQSPLVKQSPVQKITTICANKYLDAISLKVEPPIEFDGNDPDYVTNGGPVIAPGAKTPTRSMGKGMNVLDIGDPRWALEGLQLGLRQIQEGTGVSSLRTGVSNSDRQTATEVRKIAQGSEVRTIDFVQKLESCGLRPFLYMQHEYNRLMLKNYPFYNDEMSTPDFLRLSAKEVDTNVHFDIVGSRGVLGEEERTQKIMQTTAFFAGSPLFAPKLKTTEIMLDGYKDAGKKNPEEFVQVEERKPEIPPQLVQQMQQMQQILQQLQQENQQLKSGEQMKMAKIQADMQKFQAEMQLRVKEFMAESQQRTAELAIRKTEVITQGKMDDAEIAEMKANLALEREAMNKEHAAAMAKISADFEARMAAVYASLQKQEEKLEKKPRKRKIKAPSGAVYTVEDED